MHLTTRRRLACLAALTIAAPLLLAGCAQAAGEAADDEVTLLVPVMANSWDTRQTSSTLLSMQLLVTEPLEVYKADGTFEPALATEVEQPDPSTYIYTIRPDVSFSDGTELTPADVKFSFELHMAEDTTSYMARYWTGVTDVSVVGDDQVQVTLAAPDPEFPFTVSKTGIVSQAVYEESGDQVGTPDVPNIGTGPFTFDKFTAMSSVTMVANPDYWGTAPTVEKLTFEQAKDDSSRLLALQSGQVDGILGAPLPQLSAFEALDGFTGVTAPDLGVYKVNFDTTKAPFDDIHVRTAIAHAIDRDALIQGAFGGKATLANSFVTDGALSALGEPGPAEEALSGFAEDFEFDVDVAKAEMEKSSAPDGFTIEIPVQSSDPSQALVAQIIAQQLAAINITATVASFDDNTYATAVNREHSTDGLIVDAWSAGSPEPANIPRAMLTPGSIGNVAQFEDAAVSASLSEYYAMAVDDPNRQQVFIDMLTQTHSTMTFIPIAFPDAYAFSGNGVTIDGFESFWWLTRLTDGLGKQ
ncbi:ABC transporter substrate-binding protein [Microbacterium tumbae]